MYPLRFEPIFRRYLWGGRRLATELGKAIGDETCAESWEVVDRPEANSVVVAGEYAGRTLHELIQQSGEALLGAAINREIHRAELPERLRGRFPLLLKFLDANKTLSIQVHPDDAAGMQKEVPDLGKAEAWYVMDAAPASKIYCGLDSGVDREQLAAAVANKTTDQVVHALEPKTGDCIFVPAGTVHAIGDGLLIAEIQQSSDATYRLFDWNRVDADGNPRDLHIEQALEVTNYDRGPVDPQPATDLDDDRVKELIRCDKFVIRRWSLEREELTLPLEDSFCLFMAVDGEVQVTDDPTGQPLAKGQSMLIPAALKQATLKCDATARFLEIRVPTANP